ncbi:recombinase family protein [Desulfomonile tiedjei]|uniref:Site-specific recombinase, DNA invertase Pin n=1 Tax=Desulfomonile tiedjei (strain ATCC 49306 / DSM 6799 / DCB-1) TaxID=706587 RepID=I4C2C9_DESTA|nr:recombinase family protein [Desulfomonile tiedjei]AFM23720.1 site-specific recombinase, DNA invertase Pin [Desulfomonile tiedjei DSM 6799]
MKAVGYARVSSQEQIEGTSLKAQEDQIRAYAMMKGLDLITVMIDAGISGGKPLASRPEGSRLADMVNQGEVQAVVITKLDRGFRSASDCLNNVEAWEQRGVSLHILNLGGSTIDTSTPSGKFFITVMAGAAELERNLIRERCNEGRKIRKAQGCRIGEIPFGFSLAEDGKTLVKCGEEQEAIALALDLKSQGYSASGIAGELNRREITTKKGSQWTHKQVIRLLQRAA